MSITKDGFYNIEGKMFEVVHGVEGDCLILGDEDGGTRISGPKPWGGGQVTKTFVTQEKYGPIERLEAENAKLQDENARLRSCLSDDAENARQIMAENAKLRSLARQWYPHMLKRVGRDALEQWGQMDVVKELRIEVE